jgi:hypothetical protein
MEIQGKLIYNKNKKIHGTGESMQNYEQLLRDKKEGKEIN